MPALRRPAKQVVSYKARVFATPGYPTTWRRARLEKRSSGLSLRASARSAAARSASLLRPPDFAPKGQERGAYTVNADCTGSMVIDLNVPNVPAGASSGVINILFVISDGGRHVHEVLSEFPPPFSSGPQPTQTSADDWKVASGRE